MGAGMRFAALAGLAAAVVLAGWLSWDGQHASASDPPKVNVRLAEPNKARIYENEMVRFILTSSVPLTSDTTVSYELEFPLSWATPPPPATSGSILLKAIDGKVSSAFVDIHVGELIYTVDHNGDQVDCVNTPDTGLPVSAKVADPARSPAVQDQLDSLCAVLKGSLSEVTADLQIIVLGGTGYEPGQDERAIVELKDRMLKPREVGFMLASRNVSEGTTYDAHIDLARKGRPGAFTVVYTLGGTATYGTDYTIAASDPNTANANGGTRQAPSSGTQWDGIPITILADDEADFGETIIITLVPQEGEYVIGSYQQAELTLTIGTDKATTPTPPTPNDQNSDGDQGSQLAMAFVRQNPADVTGMVGVPVANIEPPELNNAVGSVSYTSTTLPGGLTINAGTGVISGTPTSSAARTKVTVTATDSKSGGAQTATYVVYITVQSKPTVSFDTATSTARESDGSHPLTVNLSPAPRADFTLRYAISGSAQAGTDFTIAGLSVNTGTLSVSAGATSVDIPVVITDSTSSFERNEQLTVTLTSGTGYSLGAARTHTLTITDDNQRLAFAAATKTEWVVTVGDPLSIPRPTLNHAIGTVTYSISPNLPGGLSLSSGGAISGTPTGAQSRTRYTVTATDSNPGTAQVARYSVHITIQVAPTPIARFALSSSTVAESGGTKNLRIVLDPAPTSAITLNYQVSGSATRGSDYTISGLSSNSGTRSVSAGATSVDIPVLITNSANTYEPSKTVVITISTGSGYLRGVPRAHTLTITDNDLGLDVNNVPNEVVFTKGKQQTSNLGTVQGGVQGVQCQQTQGTLPSGIQLICTQPRLTGTPTAVEQQRVQYRLQRNGISRTYSVKVRVVEPSAPRQRQAYIPQDPPNFCRGSVTAVADSPVQAFPIIGREIRTAKPCQGSGQLDFFDIAETLDEQQLERQRGFYITAKVDQLADHRSRFRGTSNNRHILIGEDRQRYNVIRSQRVIKLSIWLILQSPFDRINRTNLHGRNETLSGEFRICLPYEPKRNQPAPDIASWNPASLSWEILPLTMADAEQQVCGLTDRLASFVLVAAEPPPVTDSSLLPPDHPQ